MSGFIPAGCDLDVLVAEKVIGLFGVSFADGNYAKSNDVVTAFARVPIPKYSTDVAAAWQVVEKMSGTFHFFIDGKWRGQLDGKISWRCKFKPALDVPFVYGETAPHAICLAALENAEKTKHT